MDYEYKLKLKDFIPIIGTWKHCKRCIKELDENPSFDEGEYIIRVLRREVPLVLYNSAVVIGAIMGVAKGLEALAG